MSMFYERWIRIVFLILMGIALVVLPRFLPTVPEFGDSDKFAIQFFSFLAVSALIGLELLIAALQGTRAVLRGKPLTERICDELVIIDDEYTRVVQDGRQDSDTKGIRRSAVRWSFCR